MNYCTKCGKLIDDYSLMCEDCAVSNSPWVLALKNKDADLSEQITRLKAENDALRERLNRTVKYVAERIKMAFYYEFDELIPSIMADKIDELVKEVCGDD